jgi:GNAT superfamily N-acetyltransferase
VRTHDLAECDGEFLVAERDGLLLAYLQHAPHESRADWHVLNRLETRPYYRRRGYARVLVERVCAESGAALVIARAVQSSSLAFWSSLGFVPDGYGPERERTLVRSWGNYLWSQAQPHDPR